MCKSLEFKGLKVELIYSKRLKHSYLRVNPDATLCVKTPSSSLEFVYSFLNDKESWIQKQLLRYEQHKPLQVNLEDEVLLFGEIHSIDSIEAGYLRQKLARAKTDTKEKIVLLYNDFYKHKSAEYLTKRVKYFSILMNLQYSALKFRKMKSRWGSCSSKKEITLNTELMKINKELIDYVVVHELSHLVYMNHSKAFHSLVEKYLPDAKKLRKELKNIILT